MRCQKCDRVFGLAGNIRNYAVECPFCHWRAGEKPFPFIDKYKEKNSEVGE